MSQDTGAFVKKVVAKRILLGKHLGFLKEKRQGERKSGAGWERDRSKREREREML